MPYRWQPLASGRFNRRADTPGADPMWVWADATRYADLGLSGSADPELWCVVARDGKFVSERHTRALALKLDLDGAELAMPVVPQRMPRLTPASGMPPPAGQLRLSKQDRVLVGVIDSGCPFAARMLRRSDDSGTRLLGLWDQDEAPAFADDGFRPPGFAYGRAINRAGLSKLMSLARRPGGEIDEDACYRLAGCRATARASSHGAAVLSQLFAKPLYGGSLQRIPGQAPSWDPQDPAIDQADLVFVDLPRAGVQDASSAALARYLIDGLRFILAHAVPKQRVVVNISSGTSRTGHDGKSLVERALASAVARAEARHVNLQIVLPVGNTNMEQRHAVLSQAGHALTLFVPPACESPQFVTVRWPPGRQGVHLRVTPPFGGEPQVVRRGQAMGWFGAKGAGCGVISPPPAQEGEPARSLIAFAPTSSPDATCALAPAGRWRIALHFEDEAAPLTEPVQFWISRNQRNPGALARGRQADFIDNDRSHHPRAWLRYDEEDSPAAPVRDGIRRAGALSGLATAALLNSENITVVGSVYVAGTPGAPSRYSAAFADSTRIDLFGAPGDASRALPGLSVRGTRSGEVVRMVGTSFAAPLVARLLVNGVPLPAARGMVIGGASTVVPKTPSARAGRVLRP